MNDGLLGALLVGGIFAFIGLVVGLCYIDSLIHWRVKCPKCGDPYSWHYTEYNFFGIAESSGCHGASSSIVTIQDEDGSYRERLEERCRCMWDRETILLNLPEAETNAHER